MKRSVQRRLIALAMAGMLAAMPAFAAGRMAEPDAVNWNKVVDYTLCAAGIVTAATGGGAIIATIACGRLLIRYWE